MHPSLRFALLPAALVSTPIAGHAIVYLSVEQAQQAIFPGGKATPAPVKLTKEQMKAIEAASEIRQRAEVKVAATPPSQTVPAAPSPTIATVSRKL